MKAIIRSIIAGLVGFMWVGCTSKPEGLTFELSPVWVATLFANDGEGVPLADEATQRWLVAAAVYLDRQKTPFTSAEELNQFLSDHFGPEAPISAPVPASGSLPGQFILRFRSGEQVLMTVTQTRICLLMQNGPARDVILQAITRRSGIPPARPTETTDPKASDFALNAALSNIFGR